MEPRRFLRSDALTTGRALDVDEIRLVCDLRIMHSKVDELHRIVERLKQRHPESDIRKYADQPVLENDIHMVDKIYLWFIGLKK